MIWRVLRFGKRHGAGAVRVYRAPAGSKVRMSAAVRWDSEGGRALRDEVAWHDRHVGASDWSQTSERGQNTGLANNRAGRRRFLVIDPQALVRHGLALTLTALHQGSTAMQAANPVEALSIIRQTGMQPDLVALDVDGLTGDRAASVAFLSESLAGVPLIVMASALTAHDAKTLLSAGAVACVLKTDPSAVLANAIDLALTREGYVQLPYALALSSPIGAQGGTTLAVCGPSEPSTNAMAGLTKRQREIFALLLSGYSNKEIARHLGVLEGTVKVHVRAMMQKLGARNRTQIAILAARSGFTRSA
jgi:two-component system, NarL family, nitrate/nitrite response regulator NarL